MRAFVFTACLLLSFAGSAADAPVTFGKWTLADAEDAETGRAVSTLSQDSTISIRDESAKNDVVPQLVFRCRPGDPAILAAIDWGRFISSFNTELGFKVDDGKRSWRKWGVDRSEQVTSSPSEEDTRALLDQLQGGARLDVEISPYSAGPVHAQFDLDKYAEALQGLTASCR
jgi:hypothetical protein